MKTQKINQPTTKKSIVSFWDGNHPLQKENNNLWDELVPKNGEAETIDCIL